jgi:D-beta-D-heptose 7-phosphate kinase/D-beta-D-heptose 1-phosphate adenosyltransferase
MTKIFVNGTFDIVHVGHIKLLEYARSHSNSFVLVAVDSDIRVKQLKGYNRPINSQHDRLNLLSALKFVDRVEIFNTDQELIDLIKDFKPDVMVKGSDYQGKPIIGADYCKEIKFYDRLGNYSTTNKIQDIVNRG